MFRIIIDTSFNNINIIRTVCFTVYLLLSIKIIPFFAIDRARVYLVKIRYRCIVNELLN